VTEREIEEREVGFLIQPEAHFVSLVDRGANQIPFRVVKVQEGKEEQVNRVLYKVLAPKDFDHEKIKEALGSEIATTIKFDKSAEFGKMTSYEQLDKSAFDDSGFELVELDKESGIRGITGVMKAQDEQSFIAKIFKKREKKEVIEIDNAVSAIPREVILKEMSYKTYEQLDSTFQAIRSTLTIENIDTEQRRSFVLSVVDGLKSYLSELLTVIDVNKLDFTTAKQPKDAGEIMKETKEDIVKEEATQHAEPVVEDKTKTDEDATPNIAEEINKVKSELLSAITEMKEELDAFKKEINTSASPAVYRSGDTEQVKDKKDSNNIFKGVFGIL